MNKESHARSIIKSILWRLAGIIILAGITYFYTQKWIQTSLITIIHHSIFLIVFAIHERIWLKLKWPVGLTARSIAKMVSYETILGNLILGTITYLITGSWKKMTAITLAYISIKHVAYIINEIVLWNNIKWGKN